MRHYDAGRKISFLIFCWMAALFVVYRPTCYTMLYKCTEEDEKQNKTTRIFEKNVKQKSTTSKFQRSAHLRWCHLVARWFTLIIHFEFVQNFFFFFFSNKKSPKKIFKKVTVTAKGENLALAKPSPSSFDCWVNLKNKQQLVTGLYFFWCFQMFSFCRSPSGLFGV